jgi:hypothetical protein
LRWPQLGVVAYRQADDRSGAYVVQGIERLLDRRRRACVRRIVGDHFRASNQRTSALIGLDLAAYSYEV